MAATPSLITAQAVAENAVLDPSKGGMADGIAIAVAGLLIVFIALIMISLFIASLPKVLAWVAVFIPEVDEAHASPGTVVSHPESLVPDDGATLAAIGFVLHTELQKQLASEKSSKS
ncbi:MAG: OadG family protein [Rubripirellula sp.]